MGQKRTRTQNMREKRAMEYGEKPSKMKKREEGSASILNAKFGKTEEKRETYGGK